MSDLKSDPPPAFDSVEKGDAYNKEAHPTDVHSVHSHGLAEPPKLVRQLKNRHIAVSTIGGVIGTGLFVGTANALHNGGPLGLWLAYSIVGTVCFSVMVSLGEMVAYLPIEGGHIKLAERFGHGPLSFAMGWNYWYNWTVVMPAELSAAAIIIGFWTKSVNPAAWVSICLVVVIIINLLGAGAYGEAEFWFASIKVITITGLIILGIVIDLGGGPDHDRLGFRYWKNPGPFAQYLDIPGATGRFLGFWACINQAAFSFIGTEIVAIAAGEAKNPRRNLPRAIKRVYIRILLFYMGGTFIIGLLVPSNEKGLSLGNSDARGSPFVIAIQNSGIKVLPSIINAALLTSAWSAASSDLYTSSRALYGLALAGNAPRIFSKTTKSGLPLISIIFCSCFGLLSYMAVSSGAGKVFGWFANMTSVAGLTTWMGICITYLRFYYGMKHQGIDRATLPFASKMQPYVAWYAGIACFIFCFFNAFQVFINGHWATDTFVTSYLPFLAFFILWGASWLVQRTSFIPLQHLDFTTGLEQIEAEETDDPPPRNKAEAFWQWLM
ncbi:amino acid permease [Exidia glandulosa HHB12029]|uniref:Amino acid permease n=1 Tax=Exidia glandulosa HHB12029 TaxID=1314781 RepID=A0A165MCA5_EXIGL|nr:amino acid permease [Exidia glandulosa HHB12029]